MRRAYSSPISSSVSSTFDGVAYYKVTVTTDSNVSADQVNGTNATYSGTFSESAYNDYKAAVGTDVDGNLIGGIANFSQVARSALGMYNTSGSYQNVVYSLALDSAGQPYINVEIKQSAAGNGVFNLLYNDGTTGLDAVNGTAISGKAIKWAFENTTAETVAQATAAVQAAPTTLHVNGTDVTNNDGVVTSFDTADDWEVYSNNLADGSTNWLKINYVTGGSVSSGAVTGGTAVLTGNLSVRLSDGLVAVLPVSGGTLLAAANNLLKKIF